MALPTKSKLLFSLPLLFFLAFAWQPAGAFDLFYVSVGNSWYKNTSDPLGDSNLGAQSIARALRRAGAVNGITLISERGAYVTSKDVVTALEEVIDESHQADNPLIIFYFMGHGRSGGSTVEHVSVTGSYKGESDAKAILTIDRVRSALSSSGVPYILLMDNCFWRERIDLVAPIGLLGLGGPAFSVAGETVSALKEGGLAGGTFVGQALKEAMNVGTGKPNPPLINLEIYAAAEQDTTTTVPHPQDPRYDIGPLARRIILLLTEAMEKRSSISVSHFVNEMQNRSFDPVSVAGHIIDITRHDPAILFPTEKPIEVDDIGELRRGSEG